MVSRYACDTHIMLINVRQCNLKWVLEVLLNTFDYTPICGMFMVGTHNIG